MITGRQIRAARALLGWDASDLAEKAHISRETISNIENNTTKARETTLNEIERVFKDAGLDFLDFDGVRRRPEGVDVLNGQIGWATFFDRVYDYIKNNGGIVCVSGANEELFSKHHGQEHAKAHIKRMEILLSARSDIEFRVLLREGDKNFMASTYCKYRWQSKDSFVPTPFYVFGDNLALITFESDPAPRVMIIRSAVFAEAYRKQFGVAWQVSTCPPEEAK